MIDITAKDKVHARCECFDRLVLNVVMEGILRSFALDKLCGFIYFLYQKQYIKKSKDQFCFEN